jgi:hypothetical protein
MSPLSDNFWGFEVVDYPKEEYSVQLSFLGFTKISETKMVKEAPVIKDDGSEIIMSDALVYDLKTNKLTYFKTDNTMIELDNRDMSTENLLLFFKLNGIVL